MANYGIDEFFRDITGVDVTGRDKPAPAPTRRATPAPTPAPRPAPAPRTEPRNNSRGSRNNNPGNLEDGAFARSQPGYAGTDGRFARFSTPEAGTRAQTNLLRGGRYKGKSPAQILQIYAPLGDNSEASLRNYIGYAATRAGIDPDKPVPDDKLEAFAAGMREFETGQTSRDARFSPYRGQLSGGNRVAQGGQGVTPRANLDRWLESAVPGEVAASNGVGLPEDAVAAIFGSEEEIRERQAGVESGLDEMGTRINVLDAATQAAQAVQVAARTQQVEDSRRINDEVLAGTDELKRQVQPLMAARARVAEQLDELATMNPLERSLRGIFDLNYDQNFLGKQLQLFERTMQARMYDYQYLDTLQNVSLREIDRRYGIDTALSDLEVDQGTEDLALANQRLGLASQMLGSTRDSLATQSQLVVAQTQMRENVLSRLDMPTKMELMTQAQAAGGIINRDGIDFSYGELREEVEREEQQDRTIRANQIALAQGEMNLAEGLAQDLARSMTRSQLEEAAANNGVYKGIQLPADVVAAGLEVHRSRAQGQAQDILTRMPGHVAQQAGVAALASMTSLFRRTSNMLSQGDKRTYTGQVREATLLHGQLAQAIQSNADPEVIQAIVAKIGQQQEAFQRTVDASILRSVGGDKQAAGYINSFVYGSPMDAGTSAQALTYFALRGSLPNGLAISPEARQVFQRAQQLANENRIGPNGKPRSISELESIVNQGMEGYAAQVMGTPRLNDALASLPTHARAVGHPLGRLDQEWWRKTYTDANTAATNELANLLGTTPQNVGKMVQGMKAIDSTPAMQELWTNFQAQAGQYNTIEQTYILDRLDNANPLAPGRSNSELFEEFLYSPEFHNRINQTVDLIEGNSFGDYVVGPIAQGATQQAAIQYAGEVGNTASSNRVSHATAAREAGRGWGQNPKLRVMTILRSMPQLGDAGANRLEPFIDSLIKPGRANPVPVVSVVPAAAVASAEGFGLTEEARVLEALRTTKFDDPSMESYRKAAIQHWSEYSQLSDKVIQSMTAQSRR